jgi:hypothetical protein
MIDSVEMIRFFTEFILSEANGLRMTGEGLRVTRRRVQNNNLSNSSITTYSSGRKGWGEGISILTFKGR